MKMIQNFRMFCKKLYFKQPFRLKTIFAVSSGHGKCAVAIIRISGEDTANALKCITDLSEPPKPRTAVLRSIKNPITKDILDKGLILWFPGPKSFTGEDSCELHVHGGVAVVNSVLSALSSIKNLKLAEPGEFTRRAFLNGKLNLTEVEGLSDLLQAETECQRKQAFLQSQGALTKLYTRWKKELIKSLAYIEAYLDFEESEMIDVNLKQLSEKVEEVCKEIEQHLKDGRRGEILRNGVKTCIIGEPNAGKSSLFNLLCKRPAAIVTPIEGTTRDILEVTLNVGGYPLVLADTAGLRLQTNDIIEQEGILKALKNCEEANLIILLIDGKKYQKWKEQNNTKSFNDYLIQYISSLNLNFLIDSTKKHIFTKECIVVINKTDLLGNDLNVNESLLISCKNNYGILNLVDKLSEKLKILCGDPTMEHPSMNQLRHRQHLQDCLNSLKLFLFKCRHDENITDLVLIAELLRKSIRHQEKLVGKITNDEILDVIFKDFCIGK